jgi:Methyltransferase domain
LFNKIPKRFKHLKSISIRWLELRRKGIKGRPGASIEPIVPFLKNHFGRRKINVLEIGARYGESSEIIMRNFVIQDYVVVDPFKSYEEYSRDGFNQTLLNLDGNNIFLSTKSKLEKIHTGIEFIREFSQSQKTILQLQGRKFDLIFIDGNHEFEYVLQDLRNFFPMLEQGGIMCGDDFHSRIEISSIQNENQDRGFVYEAVEQFSSEEKLEYLTFGLQNPYPKIFAFRK